MFDVALHVLDVVLVMFLAICGKVSSKKTDFTVDLTWWGLLTLAPITAKNSSQIR